MNNTAGFSGSPAFKQQMVGCECFIIVELHEPMHAPSLSLSSPCYKKGPGTMLLVVDSFPVGSLLSLFPMALVVKEIGQSPSRWCLELRCPGLSQEQTGVRGLDKAPQCVASNWT